MKAPTERFSENGLYKLVIRSIPSEGRAWDTLEVEVWRTNDNHLIGTTTRNHPSPGILHFVEQDGVDYLVLSEDYHGGYGVMNLATGEKATFTPKLNRKSKYEEFWCWVEPVSHDPDARQLKISGCYWGAPYDRTTFDFSKPMSPPYPILGIEDEPYDGDEWDEDEEDEDEEGNESDRIPA